MDARFYNGVRADRKRREAGRRPINFKPNYFMPGLARRIEKLKKAA
jgi:hypothetical protein